MADQEDLHVENNCTWTFHIHKVRVGTLNKTFLLVPPLLLLRGWVQQVFCELYFAKKKRGKQSAKISKNKHLYD